MKQHKAMSRYFHSHAQSIIELSVLGAALVGILGLLIRYAASMSDAQTSQLEAMRMAMRLSAQEAMSTPSDDADKTVHHRNATVLWIEDKPTVEGGEKYGTTTLTPTITFGTGTFTNLLEYPSRWGDMRQLPYMDIIINGRHLTFTTAGFRVVANYVKEYTTYPTTNQVGFAPDVYATRRCEIYNPLYPFDNHRYTPKKIGMCPAWATCEGCPGAGANGDDPIPADTKDPHLRFCRHNCLFKVPKPHGGVWSASKGGSQWGITTEPQPTPGFEGPRRRLVFWTKIPKTDRRFCYGQGDPGWWPNYFCDDEVTDASVAFEERWRLDPVNFKPNGQDIVPVGERHKMQWQWFPILASDAGFNFYGSDNPEKYLNFNGDDNPRDLLAKARRGPFTSVDVDFDGKEESIQGTQEIAKYYWDQGGGNITQSNCQKYSRYRWSDGSFMSEPDWARGNTDLCDSRNEGALRLTTYTISDVWLLDPKAGDLAMDYGTLEEMQNPVPPRPGFTQGKAKILTLKEGQLVTQQTAQATASVDHVSKQKQDSVNMIEREIQLSNDTGRFSVGCDNSFNNGTGPTEGSCGIVPPRPSVTERGHCGDPSSPADCCHKEGREKYVICFDRATNILYVRSKLGLKTGKKMKTTQPARTFP